MTDIKKIIDVELCKASDRIYEQIAEKYLSLNINDVLNNCAMQNYLYILEYFKYIIAGYNITEYIRYDRYIDRNLFLKISCIIGDLKMCKYLVENGANIDSTGALELSADNGHIDIVKYLVERGVNINFTVCFVKVLKMDILILLNI